MNIHIMLSINIHKHVLNKSINKETPEFLNQILDRYVPDEYASF